MVNIFMISQIIFNIKYTSTDVDLNNKQLILSIFTEKHLEYIIYLYIHFYFKRIFLVLVRY